MSVSAPSNCVGASNETYRKKSGRPVPADYVNPLFLHSLSKVVQRLSRPDAFPQLMITEAMVAHMMFDFITLMDIKFGKGSTESTDTSMKCVKIPYSAFQDYSPDGSVFVLIKTLIEFEMDERVSPSVLLKTALQGQGQGQGKQPMVANTTGGDGNLTAKAHMLSLKLINRVRSAMEAGRFIHFPVVYINRRSVPAAKVRPMMDQVIRHHGKIVLNPEMYPEDKEILDSLTTNTTATTSAAAGGSAEVDHPYLTDRSLITHIVDWDQEMDEGLMHSYSNINAESNTVGETEQEYIRTLDIRMDSRVTAGTAGATTSTTTATAVPTPEEQNHNGSALVHWYYYPDSYNEWISTAEVNTSEPPDVLPTVHRYTYSCGPREQMTTGGANMSEAVSAAVSTKKPWRVNARYIYDVRIFHEWGNEYDYEIDLSQEQGQGTSNSGRTGGRGRGRGSATATTEMVLDSTEAIMTNNYELIQTAEQPKAIAATGGNVRGKKQRGSLGKAGGGGRGGSMTRGSASSEVTHQIQKERPDLAVLNLLDNCTNTTNAMMGDLLPPTLANPQAPVIVIRSDKNLVKERAEEREMREAAERLGASAAPSASAAATVGGASGAGDESLSKKRKLESGETAGNATSAPVFAAAAGDTKGSFKLTHPTSKFPEWFDMNKISAVEVRYLPEFFVSSGVSSGSALSSTANTGSNADTSSIVSLQKNPASYLKTRNFIINLSKRVATTSNGTICSKTSKDSVAYNSNYLSATDCRKLIAGDVCAILKIHEFLDVFGIINQNVPLEFKPISHSISSGSGCGPSTNFNMSISTVSTAPMVMPSIKYTNSCAVAPLSADIAPSAFAWTKRLDSELLSQMILQQKTGGGEDVVINWDSIAASLNDRIYQNKQSGSDSMSMETDEDGGVGSGGVGGDKSSRSRSSGRAVITGKDCLTRFMTMTLPTSGGHNDAAASVNTPVTNAAANASSSSSSGIADADFIGRCVDTLGYEHTQALAVAGMSYVIKLYNDSGAFSASHTANSDSTGADAGSTLHRDMQMAALTELHSAYDAFIQLSEAQSPFNIADSLLTQRIRDVMYDYHSTRMLVMEEKMKLMEAMESVLSAESERQKLERRDIQVQRAMLATSVVNIERQNPSLNLTFGSVGGGEAQ